MKNINELIAFVDDVDKNTSIICPFYSDKVIFNICNVNYAEVFNDQFYELQNLINCCSNKKVLAKVLEVCEKVERENLTVTHKIKYPVICKTSIISSVILLKEFYNQYSNKKLAKPLFYNELEEYSGFYDFVTKNIKVIVERFKQMQIVSKNPVKFIDNVYKKTKCTLLIDFPSVNTDFICGFKYSKDDFLNAVNIINKGVNYKYALCVDKNQLSIIKKLFDKGSYVTFYDDVFYNKHIVTNV